MDSVEQKVLDDLEAHLRNDDPHFAQGLEAGRPRPPREYRNRSAWLLLSLACVVATTGAILGQGLLVAGGLLLIVAATYLIDPYRTRVSEDGRADRRR